MIKHSRTFLASTCFALVLAAFAWIGTLSPSYQKCTADHEGHYGQGEQSDLHKTISNSPQIPLFLLCEGAFIDENNGTLTALATIAIAAFTLTLWRATTEQGRLTRGLERGYVAVHFDAIVSNPGDAGINIQLRNVGRSAADVNKMLVAFRYATEPTLPRQYTAFDLCEVETPVTIIMPNQTGWDRGRPFMFGREREPFCFGYVQYTDCFQEKWTYRFCVQIHPDQGGAARCPSVGPVEYREETKGWND